MTRSAVAGFLARRGGVLAVAALSALLAARLAMEFGDPTIFGTAAAPRSDALIPWLHGALMLHFLGEPPAYLYRPTIGLFFGSIIAATGRVEAVPAFFCALVVAAFAAGALRADRALRISTILWAAFVVVAWRGTLANLMPAVLTIDAAALGFGLLGCLVVVGARPREAAFDAVVGALLLGIAAALRGPMLLAGPVVALPLAWRLLRHERRAGVVAGMALAFALPQVVDAVLQRHFGIVSNGLEALYCVYAHPAHTWNSDCGNVFRARLPSALEVARGFGDFVASPEGVAFFGRGILARATLDAQLVGARGFIAALAGVMAWAWFALRDTGAPRRPLAASAVVVALLAAIARLSPGHAASALLVATIALASVAVWTGRWRGPALVSAYWAANVFLALVGLMFYERLAATMSFLLYLGLFLVVADCAAPDAAPATARKPSPSLAAAACAVVALYAASPLFDSGLRQAYRAQVDGRPAALKLADEPRLDRSLYFGGDRTLFHTRRDAVPVGAVRTFRSLDGPRFNESYEHPARFVD